MVRMTCLGQFAIDCDDRDSIFELGCTFCFLEAQGGEFRGNSAASAAKFPMLEIETMRCAFSQSNNVDVLLSICASKQAYSDP